jgi:hypothetical protein
MFALFEKARLVSLPSRGVRLAAWQQLVTETPVTAGLGTIDDGSTLFRILSDLPEAIEFHLEGTSWKYEGEPQCSEPIFARSRLHSWPAL